MHKGIFNFPMLLIGNIALLSLKDFLESIHRV